jgi:hypothetical protein
MYYAFGEIIVLIDREAYGKGFGVVPDYFVFKNWGFRGSSAVFGGCG